MTVCADHLTSPLRRWRPITRRCAPGTFRTGRRGRRRRRSRRAALRIRPELRRPRTTVEHQMAQQKEPHEQTGRDAETNKHAIGQVAPGHQQRAPQEDEERDQSKREKEIGCVADDLARPGLHLGQFERGGKDGEETSSEHGALIYAKGMMGMMGVGGQATNRASMETAQRNKTHGSLGKVYKSHATWKAYKADTS